MARKPKIQLHPDVAAALPVALATMDDAPAPARRGRKQADAPLSKLPASKRDDMGLSSVGADATPAKAPRRPKRPATAAAASIDPVPMDTASAVPGGDMQPPLPGLRAQPAAHWDRATDTVRLNWPAIERTATADGPNQAMAKLLVAARAEGANSRWPL